MNDHLDRSKKDYQNNHLRTEIIDKKPGYWTGKIHREDGSVVTVKVSDIEYIINQCENNGILR